MSLSLSLFSSLLWRAKSLPVECLVYCCPFGFRYCQYHYMLLLNLYMLYVIYVSSVHAVCFCHPADGVSGVFAGTLQNGEHNNPGLPETGAGIVLPLAVSGPHVSARSCRSYSSSRSCSSCTGAYPFSPQLVVC